MHHLHRSTLFVLLLLAPGRAEAKDAPTPSRTKESKAADDVSPEVRQRIERVENGLLAQGSTQPAKLASRMAFHKVPGVSIAVINRGEVEWARGYGMAEAGGTQAVTSTTLFQAASISKPVTAMSALTLVEEGKLSLDDDVNSKLRSWRIPASRLTSERPVTLRRLLSHSAGLTVHGFPGYSTSDKMPTLPQVLDGKPPANTSAIRVDIIPGSQFRYSGGGYCVVQQLLADVTGKPFPELMQERVLSKLGMSYSTYQQPLSTKLAVGAAKAHTADGRAAKGKWHVYPEMAAAGLWTTPSDLARFAIELQQAYTGKSPKLISEKLAKLMLTRQSGGCGLGIFVEGEGNSVMFQHGGSNYGFRCQMLAFVEPALGIVVMTNSDNGQSLINEIICSFRREYRSR